jgi:hypothetical protein
MGGVFFDPQALPFLPTFTRKEPENSFVPDLVIRFVSPPDVLPYLELRGDCTICMDSSKSWTK